VALERLLFSLDITLCLIIHVPAGIAALVGQEIEGIQMSWNQNWNEIETIQEKQARSRQARQGGSKVPFLRPCSGSPHHPALPPEVASLLQALASKDQNTASRMDGVLPDPDKEDLRLKQC